MTINVTKFLGIAPKLGPTQLGESQAQVARNCKLWSQELRAFASLGVGVELSKLTGDIQTIYYFNSGTWLCWTQDVNVVRGPIANDALEKTYFTGTDAPRVTTNALWDDGTPGTSLPPASYILGIPAPVGPPVATDSAAGTITGTVDYQYTFVRKWSDNTVDEGPPSPVSNSLTCAARQNSVTMPNGSITAANYGITHKRLYRLNGALRYYVAEVAVATSPYVDNIAATSLGSAITTTDYLPPPDGMVGLIALPNGVMAGFKDNVVYLSEPYRPWTYPAANQYTVNFPIVAIGNMLTSIVVGTTGFPSVGRGVDPAAYSFRPNAGLFPCVSKRSMKGFEFGVLWASSGGIAGFDGSGISLVTKDFITRDEWRTDFYPTTMHAQFYDGRYYAWFSSGTVSSGRKVGGGIVVDRSERAFMVTLSDYVYAAAVIPSTDQMYVADKNDDITYQNYVYQWEGNPQVPLAYQWRSKAFMTAGDDNFGFAQVVGDYSMALTAAELADITATIVAIKAANAALTSTDGPINGNALRSEINGGPLGGDNDTVTAPSTSDLAGTVTFKYWANGTQKLARLVISSNPFPLPSGFTAGKHEFEVSGLANVTQVTLATSMEELAQV